MLSRTQSMTNLEIAVKEGVSGGLKLHSSLPATRTRSASSRSLKRKHSDFSLDLPCLSRNSGRMSPARLRTEPHLPPLSIPPTPLFECGDNNVGDGADDQEQVPTPPSPVPTEIVDNVPEDFVRTAKLYGVKVRDFVYESPLSSKSHNLWLDPFFTLVLHDQHIRYPEMEKWELFGQELRRLLDCGFVTQEEADRNWTPRDWERLKEFDESPSASYRYKVAWKRKKPTAAYREWARTLFWGNETPGMKEDVYIPPDTPDLWHGDEDTNVFFENFVRERNARQVDMVKLRPEGLPGPTKSMLAQEPQEFIFDSTSFSPPTPETGTSNLPAVAPSTPRTSSFSEIFEAGSPVPSRSEIDALFSGGRAEPVTPAPTPPLQNLPLPSPVLPQAPLPPVHQATAEQVPVQEAAPAQAAPTQPAQQQPAGRARPLRRMETYLKF